MKVGLSYPPHDVFETATVDGPLQGIVGYHFIAIVKQPRKAVVVLLIAAVMIADENFSTCVPVRYIRHGCDLIFIDLWRKS